MQFYLIFGGLSWFPIIPVTKFSICDLTFSGYDRNGENQIETIASESLFKVCNVFSNAILWFLSGLVDSLSFPVTNFQFVTNISGDMIEMRKIK